MTRHFDDTNVWKHERRCAERELDAMEREETKLRAQLAGYELAIRWLEAHGEDEERAVWLAECADHDLDDLRYDRTKLEDRLERAEQRADERFYLRSAGARS